MASPDDDPIAEAFLADDPETRARHSTWATFGTYPLPAKLRAHAFACALVTVTVLAATTLQAGVLRAAFGVAPLSAHAATTLVLAAGMQFVTVGAAGLVAVSLLRRRTPAGEAVERLLAVEETATVVGLGTGGLGVVVGLVLLVVLAIPGAGPPGWRARLASPAGLPVAYRLVVAWAVAVGAGCLVAARALADAEWSPDGGD